MLPQLGWRFPDGKPEQHWRNFTVRSFDPGAATIDVDVFLHGDIGRASAWARRATVGDPVGFAGPRTHWEPDPAGALDAARRRRDRPPRAAGDPRDAAGRPPHDRARRDRRRRRAPASHVARPRRPALDLARGPARPARRRCSRTRCGACGSRPSAARRGVAARRWRCATCAATSSPTTRRSPRGASWVTGNIGPLRRTSSTNRQFCSTPPFTGYRDAPRDWPPPAGVVAARRHSHSILSRGFSLQCTGVASPYSSAFSLSPVWRRLPPARPRRGHLPPTPRFTRAS